MRSRAGRERRKRVIHHPRADWVPSLGDNKTRPLPRRGCHAQGYERAPWET
jgi:hypothetical protein